jgi:hypothetical protein
LTRQPSVTGLQLLGCTPGLRKKPRHPSEKKEPREEKEKATNSVLLCVGQIQGPVKACALFTSCQFSAIGTTCVRTTAIRLRTSYIPYHDDTCGTDATTHQRTSLTAPTCPRTNHVLMAASLEPPSSYHSHSETETDRLITPRTTPDDDDITTEESPYTPNSPSTPCFIFSHCDCVYVIQ